MDSQKTTEGERLVKLALFIKEHAPVSFADIRAGLWEYAEYAGDDSDEQRKHDQKVRRMFERDKTSLEECGLAIVVDSDNCYALDTHASFAAPVDLTPAQTSLLRIVCAACLEDEAYPLKNELRMVLAKIGDELGLPDMLPGIGGLRPERAEVQTGLKKVQKAISERKRLHFGYRGAAGKESSREVEPFGCFFFQKRCYVVAQDPSVQDVRCFRLDRMSKIKVNGGKSPDFKARMFDVDEWRRLPFQYGDERFEAVVRIDADNAWRAEYLCEDFGVLEERDGELLWRIEAASSHALAAWCAEHGPGLHVVAPQSAVQVYEAALARALEVCGEQ